MKNKQKNLQGKRRPGHSKKTESNDGSTGDAAVHSPCRAMTSTSITAQPSCWNTWMTELLPEAMPPVSPTRNIFPGERRQAR
ncbi:mCG148156 [Mus musculus]|nr:mCG148156 [Mus musculus]